jgi:hypothetical protein
MTVALGEVLGLDARLFGSLPLPTTLVCSLVHADGRLVLTMPRAPQSGIPAGQASVFVAGELEPMALGAERGRATHVELAQWHAWKLADRHWRLDASEALGGLPGPHLPRGWTLGQVFRALGLRLDEVRL